MIRSLRPFRVGSAHVSPLYTPSDRMPDREDNRTFVPHEFPRLADTLPCRNVRPAPEREGIPTSALARSGRSSHPAGNALLLVLI